MSLINMEPREKVLHSGATATGNGEILELNSEFGGLSVQISGITSATITFEGTVDGNWVEQRAVNKTTGAVATTATADGIYLFDVVGIRKFRARISAYVSGTIKVTANAVLVVPHIPELNVAGAIPAGTNVVGKVGIDQTANGVQLTDGTNVVGKVGIDQTANGVQLTDGTNTAAILANGKVPVDLTLTGDTTLAANVAIQDGTDPAKKVTVQNGAILTQLSGSKVTVKRINLTSSTEIAATNGTETIAVVVPAGKIWTVQVLRINANALIGATGNHRFIVNLQDGNLPLLDTLGQAATKSLAYMYGQFVDITAGYTGYTDLTGVLPSDKNSQLDRIKGLKMVAGHALSIIYNNYSDKAQTSGRSIYLSVIEEDIVA